MKSPTPLAITTAAALLALGTAAAEKTVRLQDLPAAVQKTVREQTRNAILVGLAREDERGVVVYEAETKLDGRTRDLTINAAGEVIEVEEELPLSQVPAAARAAIEKAAAGGSLERVESVTKAGATRYEATYRAGGRKSRVVVSSDGTVDK